MILNFIVSILYICQTGMHGGREVVVGSYIKYFIDIGFTGKIWIKKL
jgi:hypothetical protein